MKRYASTHRAVLLLPLLLLLWAQGGSCRDEARNVNRNAGGSGGARAAATPAGADERKGGTNVGQKAGGGKVAAGTWGGRGVRLSVAEGGATVEFDCAHGTLKELLLDAGGNFDVAGVFVPERGGPVREDEGEERKGQPARYSGRVAGKTMTLNIKLDEPGELPSFTLTHGEEATLVKCQ